MKEGPAASPRRVPKQARARERLGRILDAARLELAKSPVGAVTMEDIAERAGVPVGSLYQYFGSKTDLLAAVAELVMGEADAQLARHLAECHGLPWREAVDRVVDGAFAFYRDSPDYRHLLRSVRFTGAFAEITDASNERVADLMSLHPAFARTGLGRDRVRMICRTLVTVANALQDRILDSDDDFQVWRDETKRLAKGYLATYLE